MAAADDARAVPLAPLEIEQPDQERRASTASARRLSRRGSWGVPRARWYSNAQRIPPEIQAAFVRKVYGILFVQTLVTVAICATAMYVRPVGNVVLALAFSPPVQVLLLILLGGTICALQFKKAEHPTNYILLMLFTVLMSISLAGTCVVYQKNGVGYLIVEAAGITLGAFGGLTTYAWWSKADFSWLQGILWMSLCSMVAFGLICCLFGVSSSAVQTMYSLFGVVVFSGYVVFDTYRVLNVFGPDDAIVAAIELYLDLINLFLYILDLLSERR
eukprot:TRINITY_DN29556_c0_g1_i1.p1 TRINITY_DN29556_c0_g1~~TRINITY_DN29556_c0_g1_i1.p1  ORF type:complete len:274 (-),score=54.88 TRINITY_DN29556_c0_g1_i1:580-1401(-)